MAHDRTTFAREYCLCRRAPYKIKGEALYIDGRQICFSLLNLDYRNIMDMIDGTCAYDRYGFYAGLKQC